MKQSLFSFLLLVLITPFTVKAQIHPLAFGAGGVYANSNWYKDYVGMRFDVVTPAALAGEKEHTTANDGSGISTAWGGVVTTALINKQIVMPQPGDSIVGSPITVAMTGKIALVYRGGGIDFSAKALAAQTAGAIACIVVNNIPGAPVGMGGGASASSVTIPVFMISKADGDALDVQYCAGTIPTLTISGWGQNYANDLGFVPQGIAGWSNFATPANQMFPGLGAFSSKGSDGAFIANYGSHKATNVKVKDTLKYTPTGGSPVIIHTSVSPAVTNFFAVDSIYAMFGAAEYNFAPTAAGNGRFDLKYTIVSDSVDQYPADNNATYSFYTTDSVYSKGTYDFVNNVPAVGSYIAPGGGAFSFLWGPMYYIARGGSCISSVQFSLLSNTPGPIGSSTGYLNVHILKWVDGTGGTLDSVAEIGEMTEVSTGIYPLTVADTSGGMFKVRMGLPGSGTPAGVLLDSASWYYVAVEVPSGCFLGADGQNSSYPRTYGRAFIGNTFDYPGIEWNGDYSSFVGYTPAQALCPSPFPGTAYINSVDSFNFNGQKGMIPAVSLIVNNNPLSDIVGTTGICTGSSHPFTDPIVGGTWSSSTPAVATVSSSGDVTGVSAGTATITYSISSTSYATIIVTVASIPTAGFISGLSSVCVGNSITLTDGSSGGTWSCDLSGPVYGTITSSGVLTGVATGTADVVYVVSNACMTVFTERFITVGPPINTGTISGPSAVCVGSSVTLADAAFGGTWGTAGGNASVTAGSVTGITAGTDLVSYTVTTSCGSAAATFPVTVNPLPVPVIVTSLVTLSTTVPYATYQWLYSGSAIGGATDATYDATLDGAYAVTVTNDNGCTGTSDLALVSSVGVKNVNAAANGIIVSPNPTSGIFTVHTANAGTFTVYSIDGKEISTYTVKTGITTLSLPSGLAPGVYMCKFCSDNGNTATIRLVFKQ